MMKQLLFKWYIALCLLIGANNISAEEVTEANKTEYERIDSNIDEVIQTLSFDGGFDETTLALLLVLSNGSFEKSVVKLERQRILQPTVPYWAFYLGIIHEHAGQYRKAIPYYEESFALNYDAVEVYRLAYCYEQLGDYDRALYYCDQAISLDKEELRYLSLKACLLDHTGQTEEAIEVMNNYISQDPDRSSAYYARGWFEEHSEREAEAIEDFSTCIQLAPEHAYAYLNRGVLYMRSGDLERAKEDFREVIKLEIDPDDAECAYYAYFFLGDKETALEWLNKSLEQGEKAAYHDDACLYAQMGEPERAIDHLRECLKRGFRRFAHIRRDRMLDAIHDLPAFDELLKEYEAIHEKEVIFGIDLADF